MHQPKGPKNSENLGLPYAVMNLLYQDVSEIPILLLFRMLISSTLMSMSTADVGL